MAFVGTFFDVKNIDDLRQCINNNRNSRNENGDTPFIFYCRHNKVDFIREFIKYSCDFAAMNNRGCHGLGYVCENGNTSLFNELLMHTQIRATLDIKCMIVSCKEGHVDIFDIISSLHPEFIHQQDNDGKTPLMITCQYRQIDILDRLLQHDIDVNFRDNDQNTAMHYTMGTTVNISSDVPINIRTKYQGVFIDKLVLYGANINVQNDRLLTPLMYAVLTGRADLVKILLDYRARVNLRHGGGDNELQMCKYPMIANMLESAGAVY